MILLRAEREALANWVMDLSQDDFDAFLGRTLQFRMHQFSSKHSPMPVVAVEFLGWLENNSPQITTLLTAVLGEFPKHPSARILRVALERHSHAEAQATTFPWNSVLVKGIPVVNRAPLRDLLADLVNGGWQSVILVAGPERSGRTHSWHLIDHVADCVPGIVCTRVDLKCGTLAQKPIEDVFRFLMEKLHLPIGALPTTQGTTVTTIAERYAFTLATSLSAVRPRRPVWMVFDSIDRPMTPEVKAFVCTLAEQCLSGDLRECKIFLLGADRDLDIEDIHRRAQLESLSIFLPQEIADTAKALNALGRKPLSDAELAERVRQMLELSKRHPEPRMWEAIADKLVDLRIEVQA